jgi:RNA recognition motif-containing protein
MNIFVGNLSYSTTSDDLRELFEQYGEVASARVIEDRESRRSRGFGFVEMPNDNEAREAVQALNGATVEGRPLKVNEARPRESSGRSFGGGRDDRRGGGRGGYGRY